MHTRSLPVVASLFCLIAACDGDVISTVRPPVLVVVPSQLDFGAVPVGLEVHRSLTLVNSGEQTLVVDSLAVEGGAGAFALPTGSFEIPSSRSHDVEVSFTPGTEGPLSGSLVVVSNADDNERRHIDLSGRGTAASVCASCEAPPSSYCASVDELIVYALVGECVDDLCRYDAVLVPCESCDAELEQCTPAPSDAGPDAGNVDPDAGEVDPDAGDVDPDAGDVDPDAGDVDPDAGDGDPDAGDGDPDAGGTVVDGDGDGDGYAADLDCDDTDPDVYPGADEVVGDGIDQDCDGLERCYVDGDLDGAGGSDTTDVGGTCSGLGVAPTATDCNDADATENPAATWYADADQDGYGDPSTASVCARAAPTDVLNGSDCDDTRAWVHGGAAEICDGLDSDCDPLTDETGQASFHGSMEPAPVDLTAVLGAGTAADPLVYGTWGHQGVYRFCGGTWYVSLTLNANHTIEGDGAASTILDGGGIVGPVIAGGHQFQSYVIRDLTVTGGVSGGIALSAGMDATIERCVITGNASVNGGGLDVSNGTATVIDSVISGNSASAGGGGLRVVSNNTSYPPAEVTLDGVTFDGNAANSGGAILISGDPGTFVEGTAVTFTGNTPDDVVIDGVAFSPAASFRCAGSSCVDLP